MKHDLHVRHSQSMKKWRSPSGTGHALGTGLLTEEFSRQTLFVQPVSRVEFFACFENGPRHGAGGEPKPR